MGFVVSLEFRLARVIDTVQRTYHDNVDLLHFKCRYQAYFQNSLFFCRTKNLVYTIFVDMYDIYVDI